MLHEIDLRELAGHQGPERAFVSLYGGPRGPTDLNVRERRLRSLLEDEPAEAEQFDESMRMIREALGGVPGDAEGLCVFACWSQDFVRRYPLPVAVPDLLRVGPAPFIKPLAELQDEYEDFLVVAADNDASRIIRVASAEVDGEDRVKGGVKNRVKVGGWSQQRYARRREKQLQQYAKEVAGQLDALCREGEYTRIVLLGSDEAMRAIEAELPPPVAEKLAGEQAVDLHEDDRTLMDQAFALYFDEERASERRLWDQIRSESLSGGLAAAGAEDVLAAARVGRVEAMIVTRDADLAGVRCRDCDNVSSGAPERCPLCGSDSIFAVDLVDALARLLELTSATAEFSDPIPGLSKLGDVAALLRY